MAKRIFVMTNEPNLEDLLRDDIMAPVLRSAHVTPDDLRRQLAAVVRRASYSKDHVGDE